MKDCVILIWEGLSAKKINIWNLIFTWARTPISGNSDIFITMPGVVRLIQNGTRSEENESMENYDACKLKGKDNSFYNGTDHRKYLIDI